MLPGKFIIAPGETIRVFINSGDEFPASDALLSRRRIESLRVHVASGESLLSQFLADGESLTAELVVPEPGTAILALSTRPRAVRLRAESSTSTLRKMALGKYWSSERSWER